MGHLPRGSGDGDQGQVGGKPLYSLSILEFHESTSVEAIIIAILRVPSGDERSDEDVSVRIEDGTVLDGAHIHDHLRRESNLQMRHVIAML